MTIIIDREFKALIPKPIEEERMSLEESLRSEGCRNALVVWSYKGNDILLDGHTRKSICDKHGIKYKTTTVKLADRDAAADWIDRNQLSRRNLTPESAAEIRGRIYKRAKKRHGGDRKSDGAKKSRGQNVPLKTAESVANDHGVSGRTVKRNEKFTEALEALAEISPEAADKVRQGEVTDAITQLPKVAKDKKMLKAVAKGIEKGEKKVKAIQRKEKEKQREQDKRERRKNIDKEVPNISDRFELYCCDISDTLKHVEAGSVDWVVTDPPYPEEFVPLFGVLGKMAAKVLKPGGGLLCMSGQIHLPEVMSLLAKSELSYQWTLAYLTPGGQAVQIHPRKVNTFWKPIFWFTKGTYKGNWIGDVTKSDVNANEKMHHHWGQSESGMYDLMKRFVKPGDVVLDPFLGGGTTGVVALELGCKFIGIDTDDKAVKRSERRLNE